jgi:hypothetical protein
VALPTIVVYAIAIRSLSLLHEGAFWQIYVMIGFAAGFGACLGPIVYSKAITAWFDNERGIGLGIAACGVTCKVQKFVMPIETDGPREYREP